MIRVLRADAGHVPALLPMISAYWRFEDIAFSVDRVEPQLRRLLSTPRLGTGWIAFDDDAPVGYLLGVYVFSLEHHGLTAEIDELFVVESHRGDGVGAKLLAAAEATFAGIGCTIVSLQLARDNAAARGFYHRHGYSERSRYELLDKPLADE